ncbi:hypothetical protein L210DRAFT_3404233 [Boletus edulis BED1]|uniref:Zinc finger PHD-type domain-containing protein n=1 Tax=Boletus edulis BED1 TaxID=1328754 RepID=A0AAD4GEF8_BOLED|nr:hypothetical protein L210DRAFT_3404233 [Boletus edulis BED1]
MNSDATEAALGLLGLSPLNAPQSHPQPQPHPHHHHPLALSDAPPPPDSDAISCICGFTYDDGFSIACDDCSRWCHAACFGIVQGGEVPEFWKCWVCDPTLEVDKERAVKTQKGRKTSPGAERKSRRGSAVAAAIEGSGSSRKKRLHASSSRISHPNGNGSVASSSLPPMPVTFPPDIYPNPTVYAQLLRVAKAWRGVTALHAASDPFPFSHTSIYPSPPISNHMTTPVPSSSQPRPYAKSPLTSSTNTISSSKPNDTIPATTLLAPYTAAIVPSAAYLADPLNGYAHLGMGKPQVRLVGGGWEVGLDARGVGGEDDADGKARWARCGCWPNAVVRPVICRQQTDDSSDQDDGPSTSASEADPTSLSFALFALRDLKADEEIVLGWEWDDGHAVHMLPALMESPGLFA